MAAGDISIVTLRKRLADILKICPEIEYQKTAAEQNKRSLFFI